MGQIADALKKLIENSEDLSTLPQLVAKVETLESTEEVYQERINKLQEINRSYLAQIPVPGEDKEDDEDEDEDVTFEDAQEQLLNAFRSAGGRV